MSLLWYLSVFISVLDLISTYNTNPRSGNSRSDAIVYPDEIRPSELDLPFHHHHHHPGTFQHSPEFHDGKIPHQDSKPEPNDDTLPKDSENEIPLDYIQNLNKYNVSDLLRNFVDGYEPTVELSNRFGEVEKNAAIMARSAGCVPEVRAVDIVETKDPNVVYIPQCTRIERCGGCCSHKLLSCQPSEIETVTLEVIKTAYNGKKKLQFLGKELVEVEKHTKCKCDCKIQASDCNIYQEYRKQECRCACKNFDEEKKCYKRNSTKLWDPNICACVCREVLSCSTGTTFDQNQCRCVPETMKRRYVKGYVLDNFSEDALGDVEM